jgi:DNA-binding GntR family transcriptional regulator
MSVGTPNKQEQAYNIIRERILDGTYVPGYRLVIDALAREFGISPVPIREAIRRLEAESWVEYRPNSGAQVAPIDESLYEAELAVLALLEGYTTALAASHIDGEDLRHLRECNVAMFRAVQAGDLRAYGPLNKAFHFYIYGRCPNTYLVELLRTTWDRLEVRRHTDFTYIPQRVKVAIEEHSQLLDMIERQATTNEIEQFVRDHKLRTSEAYRNSPRYRPVSVSQG